jgi:hypothetical protein
MEKLIAPLPLRFFALGEDEELTAYVAKLNADEQEKCQDYAGGASEEGPASTGQDASSPPSLTPRREDP